MFVIFSKISLLNTRGHFSKTLKASITSDFFLRTSFTIQILSTFVEDGVIVGPAPGPPSKFKSGIRYPFQSLKVGPR